MKLILAPMEGLADYWIRQMLTDYGHWDWCVSEFVRVSGSLLPPKVFHRWCPELHAGSRTRNGTPVHLQLLGSDPVCVAENAVRAVELGAPAIDLNFGCPARTVNLHRGGAVLLDEPEVVYSVVAAVRRALPSQVPVSAKMRLGNRDMEYSLDNARAVEAAGASWLTVHGRTKVQGYRPPAFWDRIASIRATVALPVIANGEIWTAGDARRCQTESGCADLMLGRGAVADPFLNRRLRGDENAGWLQVQGVLEDFMDRIEGTGLPRHEAGRVKQWLGYMRRRWPQAGTLLETLKRCQSVVEMRAHMALQAA